MMKGGGAMPDDIDIHSWHMNKKEIKILYQVFQKIEPKIKIFKTEAMVWNWNKRSDGTYSESVFRM